jgi:hypothetical protein
MSDWSQDAARRFLDHQAARQVHEAQSVLDRRVLHRQAPKMWEELRQLFVKRCSEFCSEPGVGNILSCNSNGAHALDIRRSDNGATLTITFDPQQYCVNFSGACVANGRGRVQTQVASGSTETFFADDSGTRVSAEDVVEIALGDLLEIN